MNIIKSSVRISEALLHSNGCDKKQHKEKQQL